MQIINEYFSKDEAQVFLNGKVIHGADAESFQLALDGSWFAYDKHQVYAFSSGHAGLQILKNVDVKTLVFFEDRSVFCDAYRVFYYDGYFCMMIFVINF